MAASEFSEWWRSSFRSFSSTTLFLFSVFVFLHAWLIASWITTSFTTAVPMLVGVALGWAYIAALLVDKYVPFGWANTAAEWLGKRRWLWVAASLLSLLLLFGVLIFSARASLARLLSIACLVLIILVSIVISDHPSRIKWRPVVCGLLLQYALAFLVLRWSTGRDAIRFVVDNLVTFLGYARVGTSFTFGFVPAPPDICGMDGPFSFTSLPILIYFSALCAVWYYYGIIQWVLRRVSVVLQLLMGTTAAESLNAVASSIMGPTEAAVLMRYALPSMTQSEIVATIAVGSSMISGSLFATYISFGACAPLLLAANVMSAPATLVVSKLVSPEVQVSRQKEMRNFRFPPCEDANALQAISTGAVAAIEVVLAIIANLIVYLAGLAFLDAVIQYLGSLLGYEGVTFDLLIGYAFFPLAFLMGASEKADWGERVDECLKVAQLIGSKTVLNEFIAYQKMQGMLIRGEISLIAVFALCGYSNPSNIGSLLAQFAAMCPARFKNFVPAATKSFYIGSLACFMTACVAGSIVDDDALSCMPDNPDDHCLNLNQVASYFNQPLPM